MYNGQLVTAGFGKVHTFDGAKWLEIPGAPFGEYAAVLEFSGRLIVAGKLSTEDGVRHIAAWDGERWDSMQGGVVPISDPEFSGPVVTALAQLGGELIVGGSFKQAGGVEVWSLAAWDGARWRSIVPEHLTGVHRFLATGEQLVVSGSFTTIGGVSANHIAAWDGRTWSAFGNGLPAAGMLVMRDGRLHVTQHHWNFNDPYTDVFEWTGSEWKEYGADLMGNIDAAAVFHEQLILAGLFFTEGPPPGRNVAFWNGTLWRGLQDSPLGPDSPVLAFGEYQDELIVGGEFWSMDGQPINALAATDGTAWRELAEGIEATSKSPGSVTAIGLHAGHLVVSGGIYKIGNVDVHLTAQWDGRDWSAFGFKPTEPARSMTPWNGWLVVGGEFQGQNPEDEWNYDYAGYIVQAPDDKYCQPLGNGVDGDVLAVTTYQGDLIAAGQFYHVGKDDAKGIARFDGREWHALGSGVGVATIRALAVMGDDLYAGGPIWANGILRWDGSAWHQLGTGIDGIVNALAVHNGQLYAGGSFEAAGGVPARNIARWDGMSWHPLDDGLEAEVLALRSYKGRLYAGGWFAGSGSGAVSSPFLAVWGCAPCPADCDGSGSLDIDDFICFQTLFAVGDDRADCDEDGGLEPADFMCFQKSFGQGCP